MLKFLLILVYYDRPIIVRNALNSIKELKSDNWELVIIDDGSIIPIDPIVEEILGPHMHKIKIMHTGHSVEQKHTQGGSMMGAYMNKAMDESDADVVMVICDDDAVVDDALINLSSWFEANPQYMYCHSLVIPYNPVSETIGRHLPMRPYPHNHGHALQPACTVDSSQVVFRKICHDRDKVSYPFPQTACLDMVVFQQLFSIYGNSQPTGFYAQYKGVFPDQLGARGGENTYNVKHK